MHRFQTWNWIFFKACRGDSGDLSWFVFTTDHLSLHCSFLSCLTQKQSVKGSACCLHVERKMVRERVCVRKKGEGKKESILGAHPPPRGRLCLDSSLLQTRLSATSTLTTHSSYPLQSNKSGVEYTKPYICWQFDWRSKRNDSLVKSQTDLSSDTLIFSQI